MKSSDVHIVGGGIIGCAIGLALAEEKLSVTVIERGEPGREASWAAAGMLAPSSEHHEAAALAELARASAALYSAWVRKLAEQSSIDIGYRTEGTLQLAFTEEEAQSLAALPAAVGEKLTPEEARRREPALSEKIAAAVFLPDDVQVDNRLLLEALLESCRRAGVNFRPGTEVSDILLQNRRALGVRTADGARLEAGLTINAAGCWAAQLGQAATRRAPTRPVRGQVLLLQSERPLLRHVVRSTRVYVVPRADGRLLVGSTMEEAGFDKSVTPEALRRLAAGARALLADSSPLRFAEAWAGLRPGSPDGLPILGATEWEHYYVASGHFRNGILLAPVTARLMTEVILDRTPSLPLEPFSPLRFG
jgi:glycine oxidase